MATIVRRIGKDGQLSCRAQIRRKGAPLLSATFSKLSEARTWAQMTEGHGQQRSHSVVGALGSRGDVLDPAQGVALRGPSDDQRISGEVRRTLVVRLGNPVTVTVRPAWCWPLSISTRSTSLLCFSKTGKMYFSSFFSRSCHLAEMCAGPQHHA